MTDFAQQGPFVIFERDGATTTVQLNYNLNNLALMSSAAAIMHYRTYYPRVDFMINLFAVRLSNLTALANIWEHLDATRIHVMAHHGIPSENMPAKISVLLSILRSPCLKKKTMVIRSAFIEKKLAPLFDDVVFDRIHIGCAGEVAGADIPRCRKLVPAEYEVVFNIKETDALIQHVEKLEISSDEPLPDGYAFFKPRTLDLIVSDGPSNLERLAMICRNVGKLKISLYGNAGAEAAAFIRRLRHVHTLCIVYLSNTPRLMDDRIVDAIASLPCLRRLRWGNCYHFTWRFLGKLPRLEKLRMKISLYGDVDIGSLALLPRLRSVTLDNLQDNPHLSLDVKMKRDIIRARDAWERPFLLLLHLTKLVLPPDLALFVCLMSSKDAPVDAYREVAKRPSDYTQIVDEWKDRAPCKRKHHARESDDAMDVS